MGMLDRILSVVYSRINKDPKAVVAYTLQAIQTTPSQVVVGYDTVPVQTNGYTYLEQVSVEASMSQYPYSYMTIEGGKMYLYNVPGEWRADQTGIVIDLASYTISSLQSQLTPYFTVTEGAGYASVSTKSALTLMSMREVQLIGATVSLSAFTSAVWRTLAPLAFIMERTYTDVTEALRAPSVVSTSGFWLDFWAWFAGLSRFAGESDQALIQRLMMELSNPKVNNIAMQEYLTLYTNGYQFVVQDVAAGQFEVLADPAAIPLGIQITSLVNAIKAGGINWILNYQQKLSEDYRSWFAGKENQLDFKDSDKLAFSMHSTLYEAKYGQYEGGGFALNSGMLNDTPMGGTWLAESFAVELGLSETMNTKKEGAAAFGTNGGHLDATLNNTGFRTGMQEGCVMYYNTPSDSSYTLL